MFDAIVHDVRHASRSLRRAPGFTLAALVTLSVAIAATTSIFSLVDAVLIRPLPYRQPERLVVMQEVLQQGATSRIGPANALHFREWQARTRTFDGMALVSPVAFNLTSAGEPEQIVGVRTSPDLFPLLGAQPALGRVFRAGEDVSGRDRVVVLGDSLWRRRFAADPAIVGRSIRLNGEPYQVVGVLPAAFRLPTLNHLYPLAAPGDSLQLYVPFVARANELAAAGSFNHVALARLAAGISIEAARTDLETVQAALSAQAGGGNEFHARLLGLQEQITARSRRPLQLILGAAAMVLLIACVNIANLLLTRSVQRRREMAIRRATGASTVRLAAQAVIEGLMVSVSAGVVGVWAAGALLRVALSRAPIGLPLADDITLDGRALLFALAISVAAGLLIALLPAWLAARAEPADAMRASARTVTSGAAVQRIRTLLIGVEIAVSTVCLIASGLLLHSFTNLMNVDRGFHADRIITTTLTLSPSRYASDAQQVAFFDELLERTRALPGVSAAGVVDRLPVSGLASNSYLAVEGTTLPRPERPIARVQVADPDYFTTLTVAVRAGRLFNRSDRARQTAVVSARAAAVIWPGQDVIGQRFRVGPDDSPLIEVVGVVGDVQAVALGDIPPLSVYLPYWQNPFSRMSLAVRVAQAANGIEPALRDLLRQMDPELPVPALRTMDDLVSESVASRRFQMTLVLLLGMAALVLAGLGVYAVTAHSVSQRTAEFGIRMALGAVPANVHAMVLRQGLLPVVCGVVGGAAVSLVLGRFVRDLLFDVSPTDAVTFAATAAFLMTTALAASYLPARRATRIPPVMALRAD